LKQSDLAGQRLLQLLRHQRRLHLPSQHSLLLLQGLLLQLLLRLQHGLEGLQSDARLRAENRACVGRRAAHDWTRAGVSRRCDMAHTSKHARRAIQDNQDTSKEHEE
jgi:hypothetical protein